MLEHGLPSTIYIPRIIPGQSVIRLLFFKYNFHYLTFVKFTS